MQLKVESTLRIGMPQRSAFSVVTPWMRAASYGM
jgi:hypothetical protein